TVQAVNLHLLFADRDGQRPRLNEAGLLERSDCQAGPDAVSFDLLKGLENCLDRRREAAVRLIKSHRLLIRIDNEPTILVNAKNYLLRILDASEPEWVGAPCERCVSAKPLSEWCDKNISTCAWRRQCDWYVCVRLLMHERDRHG